MRRWRSSGTPRFNHRGLEAGESPAVAGVFFLDFPVDRTFPQRRQRLLYGHNFQTTPPPPRASKEVKAREARITFLEAKLKRKDEVMAELMEEHFALKKVLGGFERPMGTARGTRPSDRFRAPLEFGVRDFGANVRRLAGGGDEPVLRLARALRVSERAQWLGAARFRVGGLGEAGDPGIPRSVSARRLSRLTFMMLDANVVAASVWRVLDAAGRLVRWTRRLSSKGCGFQPPLAPHKHWHVDISYENLPGAFYYLCSVLDGYSRYLVPGELRESMKEAKVEIILARAREKFPQAGPRIISDNVLT